jgi:tRNA-splicing ligase RtcB
VLEEHRLNVHRKGATPAHPGPLALIPGSMGDFSYVVERLGSPQWLWSCSYGAGGSVRRQAVRALRPADDSGLDWHCVALRESRKVEEAPGAYKPIGPVIEAKEQAGLIRPVTRLRPWVTFKA